MKFRIIVVKPLITQDNNTFSEVTSSNNITLNYNITLINSPSATLKAPYSKATLRVTWLSNSKPLTSFS